MMRKIFFVAVLALSTLACRMVVHMAPPANPKEFMQVIYQYEQNSEGGVNIAFLAEKRSDDSASITFPDEDFTVSYLSTMSSSDPLANLVIYITDANEQNEVEGTTDDDGHLVLTAPYELGNLYIRGGWYCIPVGTWQDSHGGNIVTGGGSLWSCKR